MPTGSAPGGRSSPLASCPMSDETKSEEKTDAKPDHEPPAGAETTGTWRGAATPIDYSARAKWIVLRKKEKPAAEIFSVSYVADGGGAERPVTFCLLYTSDAADE